jgi:hypothetical protein
MRCRIPAAALAAAIFPALSVAAQQASAPWTPLPRPADTGKPLIYDPQLVAKPDNERPAGCSPLLQCRLQLLGVVQNNGSVELRATAFTW